VDWLAQNDPGQYIVVIAIFNPAYSDELPALYGRLRQWGFPHVVDAVEIGNTYWNFLPSNILPEDLRNKVQIGTKSSFTGPPSIGMYGKLVIGAYSAISVNFTCQDRTDHHRPDSIASTPWFFIDHQPPPKYSGKHEIPGGDIVIGNDVWIGRNVIILSGVRVGDGAVIGAGTVLTHDVAPYSITAGNPARHIRYRFPESTREALLKIRWWDWPFYELRQIGPLLLSERAEDILRYAERREENLTGQG
jgi:acetyltransferase-like isoleucine patch superfamily enzyme